MSRSRKLRFINSAGASLFGQPDPMPRKRAADRLVPFARAWRQIIAQRAGRTTRRFRGIALNSEGNPFPFEADILHAPLHGRKAVIACITDMTTSKKANLESQQFAALAEANPNPTLEIAPDGTLLCVNPAARRMAEAGGQIHVLTILPLDWKTIVEDCLATGRSEHRYETTREGRTVAWSFIPALETRTVRCFARFVTEQKLFLYEPPGHLSARSSLTQWAEGIAHELNNILTLIQSNASFLLTEKKLDDESVDSTRQIYSAVDRAAGLTEKLLMIGRRE